MRRNSVWLLVVLLLAAVAGGMFSWRPGVKQRDVYGAVVEGFLDGDKALPGIYVSVHEQDPPDRLPGYPVSAAELRYEHGPVPRVYDRQTHLEGALLDLGDIHLEGHFWRGYTATVPVVLTYRGEVQPLEAKLRLDSGRWWMTSPTW
ncbi:MAG TPA: hypothetical protein VGO93_22565 [Candidatus Xenobia bacterium]|jgi:hypothetical protein